MYVPGLLLYLLLLVLGDVTSQKQDHACTLWKYYDNTTNECQCGSDLTNTIRCSKKEDIIGIKGCFCMSKLVDHVLQYTPHTSHLFDYKVHKSHY